MKILMLDVETSPNTAFVWSLWKQTITIDKIIESSGLLCWSAKWYGEPRIHFQSIMTGSKRRMLRGIHRLLDQADVIVHYNGGAFDIPVLQKEFVLAGMPPPSPAKQVDLYRVVQRQFRFPSNKLDYVCQALQLGAKAAHEGFKLWVRCMDRDPAAWRKMRKYNQRDVMILERLYDRLKPWIVGHPNHATFTDTCVCPNCGSDKGQRRGVARTLLMTYPRFQCRACGTWFRGTKSLRQERPERYTGIAS